MELQVIAHVVALTVPLETEAGLQGRATVNHWSIPLLIVPPISSVAYVVNKHPLVIASATTSQSQNIFLVDIINKVL
ncbi:MAG: hypothetical protein WCG98_09510 [bacterium]